MYSRSLQKETPKKLDVAKQYFALLYLSSLILLSLAETRRISEASSEFKKIRLFESRQELAKRVSDFLLTKMPKQPGFCGYPFLCLLSFGQAKESKKTLGKRNLMRKLQTFIP